MNLKEVMDELAERLRTIDGVNVFAFPVSPANAPAGILSYPEKIEYDKTYGRGVDLISGMPLVVAAKGHLNSIDARDELAQYTAGTGQRSVKAVLESANGSYTAFDEVQVLSAEFDVITIAETDHMAAIFTLDITGPGTA